MDREDDGQTAYDYVRRRPVDACSGHVQARASPEVLHMLHDLHVNLVWRALEVTAAGGLTRGAYEENVQHMLENREAP